MTIISKARIAISIFFLDICQMTFSQQPNLNVEIDVRSLVKLILKWKLRLERR